MSRLGTAPFGPHRRFPEQTPQTSGGNQHSLKLHIIRDGRTKKHKESKLRTGIVKCEVHVHPKRNNKWKGYIK